MLNREDNIPVLVRAALGHYQFEVIHPFVDGNGRIGRLVIALILQARGALVHPPMNVGQLLTVLAVGALVGVVAAIRPARRAARMDMLQAIATE